MNHLIRIMYHSDITGVLGALLALAGVGILALVCGSAYGAYWFHSHLSWVA